ncbi:hypothetical protein BDV96DRAFT_500369 [Lophiotrema nucula]|uniref:Zn(2)-C6 fungal-type domain-containing protein n=1 Tax=Lophiotrema nucula TaxID=690887 RepID=A0A6A5YV44_9PLEO|nr:hypothetical protein BDV96DRAFT_500369 [Lophiotrema nucula]
MVYRGRPSTGCMKCRQRKIKCDERPEGCLKCFERGFVCPGYDKNQIDRFFQDETSRVKEKAEKAKAKSLALREEEDKQVRSRQSIALIEDAIGAPMLCPLIDQGIAFFMSNYTVGLDEPPSNSNTYNKHLSSFGFHPIVATSMTALGLAGISNITNNPNFKREAMSWYAKALNMTNSALRHPVEVKSDNTLLATMLLSNFEATSNEKTFEGWVSHVTGSSSLLKMRGKEQFATPAGRRMYIQTAATMAMNCFAQGIEMPDYIHLLDEESGKYEESQDPGIIYYHLQVRITDFRAKVLSGKIFDLADIIDTALKLDEIAKSAFDGVGEEWMYEEVRVEGDMRGVFGDVYHVYPHLAAAQTWNWIRYNRIYLHDMIRNALIYLWSNFNDPGVHRMNFLSATPKDRLPVIRVSGGYSSVWPLYVAGATPVASPESQQFVLTSLHRIVAEFGINQAKLLANALREKIKLDRLGEQTFEIVPRYLPSSF